MAPIPVMDRWSNLPSISGVDGAMSSAFLPMFQGHIPLIWGFWLDLGALRSKSSKTSNQPSNSSHPPRSSFSRVGGSHLNSTRTVVTGMGMVLPDLQIWLFFTGAVTSMGLRIAIYGGFSWFSCSLVVSTNYAVVEVCESRFRVIRFLRGVTFWVGLGFWADTHCL
ncbi:hypothetical protein D8674_000313 [Pyrus ussuriensis x Pyrus communis]|uniref:Uncharacterized protein n=1 Tax=Pyrus ussuriensis x Pyrus communis TaxID=2448454 RepID=A0A5N5F3Q3_9ROSA|nr:hypothetical protein D8674_000313 [Pyrus ussuriensis x Pyrus communis]